MTTKNTLIAAASVVVIAILGYVLYTQVFMKTVAQTPEATPNYVTLSGTSTCLPHKDTTGPQTKECMAGFKTDAGVYYAVEYGTSTDVGVFADDQHVTAEGYIVVVAALDADTQGKYAKYAMDGIFTITAATPTASGTTAGKLDIDVVCKSALAYTSFTDGASADAYISDCKEGKHPEVIERYKQEMGLGEGVAI